MIKTIRKKIEKTRDVIYEWLPKDFKISFNNSFQAYRNEVRHLDAQTEAEQGIIGKVPFTPTLKVTPMNYPVGKPLEV